MTYISQPFSGQLARLEIPGREMPTTIEIPAETQALATTASTWNHQAAEMVVCDQASYERAAEFKAGCREFRKKAESTLRPAITAADQAHKAMLKVLKDVLSPVEAAEAISDAKTAKYLEAQKQLQAKLQREAEAEARKQQEIAEALLKAEQEKAQALRAEELEKEIEAREAAGASPEEIAEVIAAAEVLAEPEPFLPVYVPVPVVAPLVNKVKGAGLTYQYSAILENMSELVQAAANNKALEVYLKPNEVAANAVARAQNEAFNIPGFKLVKKAGLR